MDVHVRIAGRNVKPNGIVWRIAPKDFGSRNEFDVTNVFIEHQNINSLSSDSTQRLPPHSITTIEADLR